MAVQVKLVRRPEAGSTSYLRAALKGMAITFKHLVKPGSVSLQYPEEQPDLHERWRGTHRMEVHADGRPKCVACGLCPTVCPANCIRLVGGEDDQGNRPEDDPSFAPAVSALPAEDPLRGGRNDGA